MRKNVQIIVVFALCCTLATVQAETTKRIVGYYYGKGRPGYQSSQVPVQELTRLIYSLAKPTARGDCEMSHADVDTPNLLALKSLKVPLKQLRSELDAFGRERHLLLTIAST